MFVMNVVALLPMKAHSERIPNKNIRLLAGKPLYFYVAEVLEASSLIKSIYIDTDSDVIADQASCTFSKVKIIKRKKELCGDSIPMNDIINYDINKIDAQHFLQTHSTNPLLTVETIEKAITQYFALIQKYDSLFSVVKIQTRLYSESGVPVNHNPRELICTQKLPPFYEENSNIYLFSKAAFAASGNNRIGLRPNMFVMSKSEAIDIDEEEDWNIAEALIRVKGK